MATELFQKIWRNIPDVMDEIDVMKKSVMIVPYY
jgi:hypothetical protein